MPAKKSKAKTATITPKHLLSELKTTGKLIKANVVAAKKSQQIKNVEKAFGKTVNILIKELNGLIAKAKKMKVDEKIKTSLHTGLKEINQDLSKSLKTWK